MYLHGRPNSLSLSSLTAFITLCLSLCQPSLHLHFLKGCRCVYMYICIHAQYTHSSHTEIRAAGVARAIHHPAARYARPRVTDWLTDYWLCMLCAAARLPSWLASRRERTRARDEERERERDAGRATRAQCRAVSEVGGRKRARAPRSLARSPGVCIGIGVGLTISSVCR